MYGLASFPGHGRFCQGPEDVVSFPGALRASSSGLSRLPAARLEEGPAYFYPESQKYSVLWLQQEDARGLWGTRGWQRGAEGAVQRLPLGHGALPAVGDAHQIPSAPFPSLL